MVELKTDDELRSIFPELDSDEYECLEGSMLSEGCRDPIVVWAGTGIILDGHNRYKICREHNMPFDIIELELESRQEAIEWIITNQLGRRNLNREQKQVIIQCRLRNRSEMSNRWIARELNVDHKTVGSIRRRLEATGEIPQLRKLVGADGKERRRIVSDGPKKEIPSYVEPIAFPKGRYNIIYADPPWPYRDSRVPRGGVEKHYPIMSLDDIKSLPVEDIAGDVCFLFLWVTWPMLSEGLEVINSWGFTYKTLGFVWIKTLKNLKLDRGDPLDGSIDLIIGPGHYTRSNSEPCLLGVKGSPEKLHVLVRSKSVRSIVLAPRGRHSEKPDEVRGSIEEFLGDLPRIELFARRKSEGWIAWGNEVEMP